MREIEQDGRSLLCNGGSSLLKEQPNRKIRRQTRHWKTEDRAWRSLASMPNAKIWTLQAAEGFVANMNLLHVGTSTLRASQFAHAYWAGEEGPKLDGMPPPCWEVLLCGPITVGDEV